MHLKKICESTTHIKGRHHLLCLDRHARKSVELLRVIWHLKRFEHIRCAGQGIDRRGIGSEALGDRSLRVSAGISAFSPAKWSTGAPINF
jgi:hypothetical protein